MDAIPTSACLVDMPDGMHEQTGVTSISQLQADDNITFNE